MRRNVLSLLVLCSAVQSGCLSGQVERTDGQVYQLIENRQNAVLGISHDSKLEETASVDVAPRAGDYSTNPRPIDTGIPEAFRTAGLEDVDEPADETADTAQEEDSSNQELIPISIFTEQEQPQVTQFNLQDAIRYAARNARELQGAKEELYLAALDLTLERHLWTPQFVASVEASYANRPDFEDPDRPGRMIQDRAMTTISELGVSQRLPYGGEVSARVIHTLVREVSDHVAQGETGQVILDANIPLLRGAGRSANTFEALLSSERSLVYAVRDYERFRRRFLVNIASDYFNLQQLKASIANTHSSYLNRHKDWEKADFIEKMGRSRTIAEAPRAKANFRGAEASLVSAKERYESALDRFKIRISMPVESLLDVLSQADDEVGAIVDRLVPNVSQSVAQETALLYRLDYLNSADRLGDLRRGLRIAKNRILPDLDLSGSMIADSDPEQMRSMSLREERLTWSGSILLSMDDRKSERNAYRRALIDRRKSQRDYEEQTDTVRAEVRRALRQITQQKSLRTIQEMNVAENDLRLQGARQQLELGRSRTNQDVVDAENDLLRAKNDLASAISDYRVAILAFRIATGTLRLTDSGRWVTEDVPEGFQEDLTVEDGG